MAEEDYTEVGLAKKSNPTAREKVRERQILLMFVKQIFEDFENLENKKESNLNKTCCCRPAVNSYNESGQIYLYNSIARA